MVFFGRKRSLKQTMRYHDSPANGAKVGYSLKGFGSSDVDGGSTAATTIKGHGSNVRKLKKRYMFITLGVVAFMVLQFLRNPRNPTSAYANEMVAASSSANVKRIVVASVIRHPTPRKLRTLQQIQELWELPCNYVHDGYYIEQSNWILEQVYLELQKLSQDPAIDNSKIVPVVVEVGGHDGITKSLSLKSSRCLHVNTLLVEASPSNYNILRQTRSYDTTVNAALCQDDSVQIYDNPQNSGASRLIGADGKTATEDASQLIPGRVRKVAASAQVPCTSLDVELDTMMSTSFPTDHDLQLKLIFMVMDVEGHEAIAIQGLTKYSPHKVMMETKQLTDAAQAIVDQWATRHNLTGDKCGDDTCYNFEKHKQYPQEVFYGSRLDHPEHTYKTSEVSKAYMYYGN